MTESITILLTGFSVVFAVLLVLIGIIKLYGTIIYNLQNKSRERAKRKVAVEKTVEEPVASQPAPVFGADTIEEQDDALIAVIAAAVYTVYSPSQVRIRSIRRSPAGSNAWRAAGLRDNTRTF